LNSQVKDCAFHGKVGQVYCDYHQKAGVVYDETDWCKDMDGYQGTWIES
jgi:hypothetical protein